MSSIAFASDGSLVIAYREAIGGAKVILQGDRLTVRPIDVATGLVSNKVVLVGTRCGRRDVDRHGLGRRRLRPELGADARVTARLDGMISEDLDQNAFLAEPDGTVWLGSSRGLDPLPAGDPARSRAPAERRDHLTNVSASDRRLDPRAAVPRSPGRAQLQRVLGGPDLRRAAQGPLPLPDDGLVDQYTETDLTEARFPALPSGDYRFEVLCVSAPRQGIPAAGRFPPPRPARLVAEPLGAGPLGLLAAAAALTAFVRWRTRHLEAERHRLEEAVAARSAELAAANRELREASFTDALTGARNRRFFSTVIEDDVNRTLRVHSTPPANRPRNCDLIFYIVDIDHFKEVNDEFGHDRGDGVLAEMARRLTGVVRDSDRLIRWGGEEFLLISRDADRTRGDVLAGPRHDRGRLRAVRPRRRPEGPPDLLGRVGAVSRGTRTRRARSPSRRS